MHEFELQLRCGHTMRAKMALATARYRRQWLTELPMQAKCPANCTKLPQVVTKIYRHAAEELLEAKALGATNE